MKKTNLLLLIFVSGLLLMSAKSYGQFKGTYTIDTTGSNYTSNPSGTGGYNYKSFTTAAWNLAKYGVSGVVIFNAASGTYAEQVTIGAAISGASSTNTITFQSASGDSTKTIIQYAGTSTSSYVVSLTAASYITFKKMTLQNTGTAGCVVLLNASCSYNSFLNNQLIGISGSSASTQSVIYGLATVSYNTFSYNNILNGYASVYFAGNTSNTFTYNNMSNFYAYGFNLTTTNAITINYNKIVSSLSTAAVGVYASSSSGAMTYIGNTITITGRNISRQV